MNPALVEKVKSIVMRLLETFSSIMLRKWMEKAEQLLDLYSRNGFLRLVPWLKKLF